MELGAAITVILASQYGLPVSTMCITGATLGVALCNGDIRAVNFRALGWIFLGWVITVPVVGTLAGCLMGIILMPLTSRRAFGRSPTSEASVKFQTLQSSRAGSTKVVALHDVKRRKKGGRQPLHETGPTSTL